MRNTRYKWDNAGGVLPSECGEYVSFQDHEKLQKALERIFYYNQEDIWWDSRDDAANDMLKIAGVALGLEEE